MPPRLLVFLAFAPLYLCVSVPVSTAAAHGPASFSAAQSLFATSSAPGNVYVAGFTVVLTAPVEGDFAGFGGSIITAAPVAGDDLLVGGTIHSRASVDGDMRALGGKISIDELVKGDIAAIGYRVDDRGRADGSVFIAAVNTTLADGAKGPVTIYGNNISLAGDFGEDVTVFASGRVTLAASTTIHGALSYESPEPANIPTSATIVGGVTYTDVSYVPNIGTSRILALLNLGFFLFVRFLGALLLAGLLAGLFPRIAESLITQAYAEQPRHVLLTILLGFAIAVATPILCLLLLLTFVGIGLAFILILVYALLILLAFLYAGIVIGGALARRFVRREIVLWRDGVIGMLVLSIVALVPFVGLWIVCLLALFMIGALLQLFFRFAFLGESHTVEMLKFRNGDTCRPHARFRLRVARPRREVSPSL